ncbi:glycosyltransferase family 2 protein [Streptomyces sp. NPDC046939]|uniref:glycosyltransferase family 2 protein n=1 Tax=Streptomyces sp. NPDC046939 TaxID=3155376 RepID=UPI0033F8F187
MKHADPFAPGRVSVVVIVHNDAGCVAHAVRSALAQGESVAEVVVVDDASADTTPDTLRVLAADSRVRVVTREHNSGGCGTPRNDGLAAARAEYVMFLDSDDALAPGAVDALLVAAAAHRADVVAGRCLRRELPDGRTTVWQPQLFDRSAGADLPGRVVEGIGQRPELLWDTLAVNKLYRRDFLTRRRIRFPEGAFPYEDFVFTARLYAAEPRLAVVERLVYIWYVRRQAADLSVSLRRATIANWQERIAAHRQAVEVLRSAGHRGLAATAQGKFLDHDVPMYARELPLRTRAYQHEWWRLTADYLGTFDAVGYAAARVPHRWLSRVIEALDEPADLGRLVELAARPPRLAPPYSEAGSAPAFGTGAAAVPLAGLDQLAAHELPIAVDGRLTLGRVARLALRVHDLYGRLAALEPRTVRVVLLERSGALPEYAVEATLVPEEGGWRAEAPLRMTELTAAKELTAWSLSAEVRCAGGEVVPAGVRAPAAGQARRRVVVRLGRPLFVQVHVAPGSALVLRVVDSARGLGRLAEGRVRRLRRRLRG